MNTFAVVVTFTNGGYPYICNTKNPTHMKPLNHSKVCRYQQQFGYYDQGLLIFPARKKKESSCLWPMRSSSISLHLYLNIISPSFPFNLHLISISSSCSFNLFIHHMNFSFHPQFLFIFNFISSSISFHLHIHFIFITGICTLLMHSHL